MKFISSIILGIKRDIYSYASSIVLSYAAVWTIAEPVISILGFNLQRLPSELTIASYLILSFLSAALLRKAPDYTEFRLKNFDTTIKLSFGDLFTESGIKVIGVNEFFDSEIGKIVSTNSLHGKFLQDILQDKNDFDEAVKKQLSKVPYKLFKKRGKKRQYQLGTSINLDVEKDSYLLFALSHTNTETLKAYGNINDLIYALEKMWRFARNHNNGKAVIIPLLGGGLLNLGLPPQHLLNLLLISILIASKNEEVAKTIHIVIKSSYFNEVDLRKTRENWS